MTEKTKQLMDLYGRIAGQTTFTERQTERRGDVPSERAVDAALRRTVRAMRERYGFRTSLSDDDLVRLVRGYYAGERDAEIAAALDCAVDVVSRARIHLHLFREDDLAGVDPAALRRLVDADVDDATAAAELGATPSAVARARRALDARREAQRATHRYQLEFEDALDLGDEADLVAGYRVDRRLFDEVHD